MHPLLRGSTWLNGPAPLRHLLGPYPGALISLNLLAGLFVHAHSDASMRILHGYSSIGLIPGLLTGLLAIRLMLQAHHWPKAVLALAVVIGVNLRLAWTFKQRSTPIQASSGQDLWRRR